MNEWVEFYDSLSTNEDDRPTKEVGSSTNYSLWACIWEQKKMSEQTKKNQ